jgi:molybdate transport system substrate-binding protein
MRLWPVVMVLLATGLLVSCNTSQHASKQLTVAAAANLTDVFDAVGSAFQARTGTKVVFSYGPTAELAQQIDNGGPYDVFAAADTQHVDALIKSRKLSGDSRAIYALGQLVIWIPKGEQSGIKDLKDLGSNQIRFVAVAKPELAPYGEATVQALTSAGLWQIVHPKVVYANSISQAKQFASSGNADAAFTAYSLVLHDQGTVLKVDPQLYHPIEQALALVAASAHMEEAKQFRAFLLGSEGRAILEKSGYLLP